MRFKGSKMKRVKINLEISKDKILTAIETEDMDLNEISINLELIGLMENLKQVFLNNIKDSKKKKIQNG